MPLGIRSGWLIGCLKIEIDKSIGLHTLESGILFACHGKDLLFAEIFGLFGQEDVTLRYDPSIPTTPNETS
jgi:hypothetical protein